MLMKTLDGKDAFGCRLHASVGFAAARNASRSFVVLLFANRAPPKQSDRARYCDAEGSMFGGMGMGGVGMGGIGAGLLYATPPSEFDNA